TRFLPSRLKIIVGQLALAGATDDAKAEIILDEVLAAAS
ncbi:CarD family transcriptional regulator, partial [Rhodococcus sp. NPDC058514]